MTTKRQYQIKSTDDGYIVEFLAMASPCEIHIQATDNILVNQIAASVCEEVWRIEDKFSRYDKNSLCSKINNNAGKTTPIDRETYLLLMFASQCFELSDGLFDISSGILRKIWRFDGSNNMPSQADISTLMPFIGWNKVSISEHNVTLPQGMEIDFGGIGKEYAVDKAIALICEQTSAAALVNLGGDLACCGVRNDKQPWQVGVEKPGGEEHATMVVSLNRGALATSGDAKRFIFHDNQRYSHILDATTGWPVINPPRSMTVAANTCMEAGVLATLSMMQGKNAEQFLTEQDVQHWAIK